MISKEQVINELHHIASILILADPTEEWGGEDEASDGKPGRLNRGLANILNELPVDWDKNKATFKLSGINKLDDKGLRGIKTWVRASLPGKFEGKDFSFEIYRDGKRNTYYFKYGEEASPKFKGMTQIKSTFEHFLGKDSGKEEEGSKKTTRLELLNKVNDSIYRKGGEIYKEVKEVMKNISEAPVKKFNKDTANHNIYLNFYAHKEDLKTQDPSIAQESLAKLSTFISKFISEEINSNEGFSVKSSFRPVKKEDHENPGYVLRVTIKF